MALTKVTGHVVKPDTNIQFHNTKSTGIVTFAHTNNATSSTTGALQVTGGVGIVKDLHVGGNITVGGTLTYDDVTNIDSLGIITARGGIHIGPITAGVATVYTNGNASFTGIITATSFVGSGANLTSLPAQITFSNPSNNRILTSEGGIGVNAESKLTFDSTTTQLKITRDDDSNSGLYVFHNDGNECARLVQKGTGHEGTLVLRDGGTAKVLLDGETGSPSWFNAGNVGIGTQVPAQLLDVAGTIKTANITSDSSNLSIENTADRVLIKSANRVDIADNMIRFQNRAQDAALLEAVAGASGYVKLYHNNNVVASVTQDALTVTGRTSNSGMIEIASNQGANNNDRFRLHKTSAAQRLSIQNYASGSWVENIRITAGGLVELKHADGTTRMHTDSTGITVNNRITAQGDSNTYINVGSSADTLDFYTGGSNYFRLNSDGNLLVNKLTTSDKGRFEVKGPTSDDIETSDISAKTIATFSGSTPGTTAAGKGAGIVIKPISDRGCNYFIGVAGDSANQESHGRFIIRSGNFYNQSVERLRIGSNGYVGIGGTTIPSKTVDVIGNIRASVLYLDRHGSPTINMVSTSDTGGGAIYFGSPASGVRGGILYDHNNDQLKFRNIYGNSILIDNSRKAFFYGDMHMLKGSGQPGATLSLQTHDTANSIAKINLMARDNSNNNETCYIEANSGSTENVDLRFGTNGTERLRITSAGNVKLATSNSTTDYLQFGSNPRLWLRCPSNMNGLRIDASTTPLEVRSSDANQRSISIGGAPNFDLSLSGDYSLSSSSQRDSSPTIYLNATRWNGSTTVTSFQTSIQAVNTSNSNNIGYLGFGAAASPTNLTIHTSGHICLNDNDTSDLTDTCRVRIASTFKNTVRNGSGRCVERGFYSMNTGSGSVDYFHMKTDMATNSGCMFLFTLRGYAYGSGKVMFAQTCGYCYSATNSIINDQDKSWDGDTVLSTYKSSDGYVVLRAYLSSWSSYYTGFHIDVSYQNPATGNMKYKVTASSAQLTSSDYYA